MLPELRILGRLLRPDGSFERGGLSVHAGRIVEVGPDARGETTLDFGDRILAPGGIDPHVHFRDPGHPEKEDFGSGSRAAALGGVTTVLDMPNTVPPTFTKAALDDKLARAGARSVVDFGLFAGLDDAGASLAILPDAVALKIYLGASTGNLLVRDAALVRRALVAAAAAGRTVVVHAEHQGCLERHAHLADDSYPSHSASRPPECEADAIRMVVEAARGTGARVHVAHLSTRAGLEAIAGTGFTAEVCPHHLFFDAKRLDEGGRFKMNPPLRARSDADALWAALVDGRIACLASDHAPHTPAEKDAPRMGACPAGVPGVQTMLPLLLADARVAPARVWAASTAAARIFGLARKGALAPGMDADVAVYDLAARRVVRAADMASRAGWTPFEGLPAVFPTDVFVRGARVVEDGRLVARPPPGRVVASA